MAEKFTRWDPVDHLKTDEDTALYLDACLNEDPGDGSLVRAALNDIARAHGMSQLARDTGLTRKGILDGLIWLRLCCLRTTKYRPMNKAPPRRGVPIPVVTGRATAEPGHVTRNMKMY